MLWAAIKSGCLRVGCLLCLLLLDESNDGGDIDGVGHEAVEDKEKVPDDVEGDDIIEGSPEAIAPKTPRDPGQPTPKQITEHTVSHLPYRS